MWTTLQSFTSRQATGPAPALSTLGPRRSTNLGCTATDHPGAFPFPQLGGFVGNANEIDIQILYKTPQLFLSPTIFVDLPLDPFLMPVLLAAALTKTQSERPWQGRSGTLRRTYNTRNNATCLRPKGMDYLVLEIQHHDMVCYTKKNNGKSELWLVDTAGSHMWWFDSTRPSNWGANRSNSAIVVFGQLIIILTHVQIKSASLPMSFSCLFAFNMDDTLHVSTMLRRCSSSASTALLQT